MDFVLHGLPNGLQEIPDLLALAELYVLHKIHIAEGTELLDLGKGVLHVDIIVFHDLAPSALDDDIAASDAFIALAGDFIPVLERNKIQSVRVFHVCRISIREHDLHSLGRKGIDKNSVGSVTLAGL